MPFPNYDERPQRAEEPCAACKEPTRVGVDIDRGRGYVRYPVCNTDCWQNLMEDLGSGGAGAQMRAIFPSREDV